MSELALILIALISFGAGNIIGWVQRDRHKELDAIKLARHIINQCTNTLDVVEEKQKTKLRKVK